MLHDVFAGQIVAALLRHEQGLGYAVADSETIVGLVLPPETLGEEIRKFHSSRVLVPCGIGVNPSK